MDFGFFNLHGWKIVETTLARGLRSFIPNEYAVCNMITGQSYAAQHGIILLSMVLLLLLSPPAGAQSPPNGNAPYTNFSPSMAVIIAVLVAALFFMGFFSIYIRRCTDTAGAGGSVRPILSMRRRGATAARGLDLAVVETFPTFEYSVVKSHQIGKGALECAVCLNEFEDDEKLRLIPKCDHVFHSECIDQWLDSHVTCPVCRANLVPQPGESLHLPDLTQSPEINDNDAENRQNGDVSIRVSDDYEVNTNVEEAVQPEVINRNPSTRQNRPPRSRSVRPRIFQKFRSHSTGHSLVQPGENTDRFTLRLPEDVRKQVIKRALLNRTASCMVTLPREESSRKGYRTGEGSSRGKSYDRRFESLEPAVRSDRWNFSRAPSFLWRAFSVRSPRVVASDGEGSTSANGAAEAVKKPKGDKTGLVSADSARPPV
ncbi:hypothetical protein RJ639_035595 [Escallonia herrerae]|uniref:RING-type E3 ubiquitin transferase n=1 Tax=Escallonia herrerae TaxID=1293975 RepID=A0AA89B6K3_9ASTE|nr:hypothetical protein RJ639_035595 [Escallonia herrerae]